MKKLINKLFTFVLVVVLLTTLFTSCNNKENDYYSKTFNYNAENLTKNPDYNGNLFYLNSLDFHIADPSVIYINEGKEEGYFYAYGTSDEINCHGFESWRSKDLTHWENMGIAFKPDYSKTWATTNYWAPEVIYDRDDKLYYMFYNAENLYNHSYQCISVAYSENPNGPFELAHERRNFNGEMLYSEVPVLNLTPSNSAIDENKVRLQAIDASPFIDPVSGERYLYFSYYNDFNQSEIFGMKMKDWFTPDYSTLTQLTVVGWLSLKAKEESNIFEKTSEGSINEGPFMIYNEGTYYLTLSVYGYRSENYQVRQAIGTSPLGDFIKISVDDGGAVIATDSSWKHVTSSGHHCFITCGDEKFIAYHTFKNRTDISNGRALAIDRVAFIENSKGQKILHSNGPTYSLQALPEQISGYKNISSSAEVSATNTLESSDVKYLKDGILKLKSNDFTEEYETKGGTSIITFLWKNYKTARAIMIYNSFSYEKSFVEINKIKIYYKGADGNSHIAQIGKISYDFDFYADINNEIMFPGGNIKVEFDEILINKIEIIISSPSSTEGIAISEIEVLGRDSECKIVDNFKEYSYTNPEYPSPILRIDSHTFGTISGTSLSTMYGYDLSHDDGTEKAYIEQKGCYDQYCYFKDIFSKKYYIEAEFSVIESKSYAKDAYPKFGIVTSCLENSIFFYVDAAGFTKKYVGCAQRKLDNSSWNWIATEQLVQVPSIKYTEGDYVKLSMLRDGKNFYLYVNDELVISYSLFSVFNEKEKAGVGFLSFNTGMSIKNYFTTQESSIVDDKYAQLSK